MRFITSKREYQSVYQQHTRKYGNLFIFLIRKDIHEDQFAVGIVVSKKVGNAVIRNKVKRRLKAFIRENKALCPSHTQVVIKAKPLAGSATWQDIKIDLTKLFGQII